jgi:hypothetical protein
MDTRSSQSDRPSTLESGDVPFVGWSRVAHEFRVKAAEMAPGGFLRPLIIGDPGVGKKTMARAWLRVAGRGEEEWPIVDLDTWRDAMPDRCIAVTTRRPPSSRPCFLLESGTWGNAPQRPPDEPTLPADLMQRFAITLYVPPLYGHREIDILAFLDYWTKVQIQDYGIRYWKIDAALVHRMLFEDDWPANLEGISRALRRIRHSDFHNHNIECNIVNNIREINVLKDRMAHLGWFAPPNAETRQPGARPVKWLWGKGDIPVGAMADLAVRLYLRLCQLSPPGSVATHLRGPDPRELLSPQNLEGPGPTLTALQFLGLSPESFVREVVLPGVGINSEAREGQVARFLDLVTRGSIFGTDVPTLQAGLAIDPVAVARMFAPSGQLGPRRSPAIPVMAPEPIPAASGHLLPHRFCIEDGIFRVVFQTAEGRTENGRFPCEGNLGLAYYRHLIQHPEKGFSAIELAREVGRKDAPPEQRHERATAGEGYGSGTSYDPVLDKEGKQKLAQGRDVIARELEEARRKGDRGRIVELETKQKFINAELKGAIHIRKEDDLDELGRQLRAVDQELEEARRDGDFLVIQELEADRRSIVAKVAKIVHGHKDKNLDKSAKQARDSIRKAMGDARTKLIRRGLRGLALYLEEAVRYKDGSWTYRPSKSSRDWLT